MSARPATAAPTRNFRGGDIREAVLQGLSAASVRLLPPRGWAPASDCLAGLLHNRSRSREERFRRAVRAVLGDGEEGMAADLRRRVERHAERRRTYIAALQAGGRWSPSIELIGLEEVLRPRATGSILWFDFLSHYAIPGKMALAGAGLPLWQLSSHDHGISATRFGQRFLNPRQIRVENRYLHERIAFDEHSIVVATRRVMEILDQGGVVAITNIASLGHAVAVPFGAAASLKIATTPLKLALRGKATVFPVSVIETEPLKSYRVTIRAPLSVPSGDIADPVAAMLAEYTDYFMPLVRAHPDQWAAWRSIA